LTKAYEDTKKKQCNNKLNKKIYIYDTFKNVLSDWYHVTNSSPVNVYISVKLCYSFTTTTGTILIKISYVAVNSKNTMSM